MTRLWPYKLNEPNQKSLSYIGFQGVSVDLLWYGYHANITSLESPKLHSKLKGHYGRTS